MNDFFSFIERTRMISFGGNGYNYGKTNEFQLTSSLNFPDFVSNVCEGGNHINNCIDARNQYSSIFKATFVLEEK